MNIFNRSLANRNFSRLNPWFMPKRCFRKKARGVAKTLAATRIETGNCVTHLFAAQLQRRSQRRELKLIPIYGAFHAVAKTLAATRIETLDDRDR